MDLALSVYPSILEKNMKMQNKSTEKRFVFVVAVRLLSRVQLFSTPWTAAHQAFLPFTVFWHLLKLTSIELVLLFNHLILCCPLLLQPSIFPNIKSFSNESALHIMWPKYWSFRFSISPSNEYSGLISFKIGWFDLPDVQGTLKSFLPHQDQSQIILLLINL